MAHDLFMLTLSLSYVTSNSGGGSVAYLQSMKVIDMGNLKPDMYHLMDEVSMEQRKRFIYILYTDAI